MSQKLLLSRESIKEELRAREQVGQNGHLSLLYPSSGSQVNFNPLDLFKSSLVDVISVPFPHILELLALELLPHEIILKGLSDM